MTKYAKLKAMKDNFILAASKAKDNYMIELWTRKAADCQKEIDEMSIETASEDVNSER